MFEYITENERDNISSLVVFLHGYNGCIEDHAYALSWFRKYLQNSLIVVPIAPEICDKNPSKKQWFGMKKYDPENLRFDEKTSVEQIFEIYNRTETEISERAKKINFFISEMQKKYSVDAQNTYLIGFSQGAMLALYAALICDKCLGGVFVLSGLIAGMNELSKNIRNVPSVYIFHGKKDNKVQYKTVAYTQRWLNKNNINYKSFIYEHLAHKICEDEVIKISELIK